MSVGRQRRGWKARLERMRAGPRTGEQQIMKQSKNMGGFQVCVKGEVSTGLRGRFISFQAYQRTVSSWPCTP